MATEKVQVVFMTDTSMPHDLANSLKLYHRSVCLAAVRILLYLSRFPIREHLTRVLWNFKLFNSERIEKTTKTWQFNENRSELIENFFQKLHESLEAPIESMKRGSFGSQKPVKLVYNALAAVIQDFVWDAPEIMSPIRPRKRSRIIRTNTAALNPPMSKENSYEKNIVFIFSSCPASEGELRQFCYGSEVNSDPISVATVREQLLPAALLTQLSTKHISVHWVHTGAVSDQEGCNKMYPGLDLMSEVLKKAGGTVIPLSTLVSPLASQLKIQHSSLVPHSKFQHSPTSQQHVHHKSLISGDSLDSSQQAMAASLCSSVKTTSILNAESPKPVDCSSVVSTDSEIMKAPSIPKNRLTIFPSREFLSSLVLPAPSMLKEYLHPRYGCGDGYHGDFSNGNRAAALRADNLLWFSTKDGEVLFIVELQPMCRLLTPNLRQVGEVTHITNSRSPVTKRRGSSRMLSKKLSLSRVVNGKSRQLALPEVENSRLQSQSTDENSIPYCSEVIPSEHSKLDMQNSRVKISQSNSNSHSNTIMPSLFSVSPSMVALGLVRQADLPLTWLDPTAVYSCNGLYVPRKTRSSLHSKTKSSPLVHQTAGHSSAGNSFMVASASAEHLSSTTTEKNSETLDGKSMVLHTPASSSFHSLNLTPILRLDRYPLSSLDSRQNVSSSRLRRSSSVPKELACSFSDGLLPGGDGELAEIGAKKMQKIKRSESLPSSPVVLCSKLPLSKLRNCSNFTCNDESSSPASGQSLLRPLPPVVCCKVKEFEAVRKKSEEQEDGVSRLEMSKDKNRHPLLPGESVEKSGRYCSKQYINLCLWLAKNALMLVVRLNVDCGSCLGVLQPVTSLVSTLSLLKPQNQKQLFKKLVNPLMDSGSCCGPSKIVSLPLISKRQLSNKRGRRSRKASGVLRNQTQSGVDKEESGVHGTFARSLPGSSHLRGMPDGDGNSLEEEEDGFVKSCASDCELYTGLQLLFRKSSEGLSNDSLQSCLLSDLADAPPFTHLSLLPWFPYTQCYGITHQDIERLQELQLDVKDSEYGEVQRKTKLVDALKELYSRGQIAAASLDREDSDPPNSPKASEQLHLPTQGEGRETVRTSLPNAASLEDLCEWFLSLYEEQVDLCPDGDSLLRWSTRTLAEFQASLRQLLSSELTSKERQANLWEQLQASVLLSSTQLGMKYERLVSVKEEQMARDVEKERTETTLQKRKITEHLLQILLHFEAMKICPDVQADMKETANTLVQLFRKLSLLANPGLLGSCLKKIILPVYLSSCQEVLTEVYERLMLPLPSDLMSSPDRPLSPEPSAEEGEGESSEEWTPLMSLEEPPAAPKVADLGSKRLARHMSFHDNQSHRQITVLNKKKRKRKRHKTKQKSDANNPPRRSPRVAKLAHIDAQKGKGACRSLFSRSLSVSYDIGIKRKREREEHSDVENHPVKRRRGVHTLQRHYTVVDSAPTSVPLKSPRKFFQSGIGTNVPRQKTTPQFKTPPLKENTSKVQLTMSPRVLLNKEPSPAAIYSLLHGQIVSPQEQDGGVRTPFKSTKDAERVAAAAALTMSPQVRRFEKTPDTKRQPTDSSVTPLAHRGGSSLAPPRDLSLMLSPGVMASYMVSNTPSSLAKSVDRGSIQLAAASQDATTVEGEGIRKTGFKSARMLTYESEDPLLKKSRLNSCASPLRISTTLPNQQNQHMAAASNQLTLNTIAEPVRTLNPCNTLQTLTVHDTSSNPANHHEVEVVTSASVFLPAMPRDKVSEVELASLPVGSDPLPTANGWPSSSRVCLLTDLDPSLENESASMMAFALCTPTKDDPKDFLDAFI